MAGKFKLILNGMDYSAVFNDYAPTFGMEKVEGDNSGTSMAGSSIIDLVAVKTVITTATNCMTDETYNALFALCANAYITVQYTGLDGQTKTMQMIPTLDPLEIGIYKPGTRWWRDGAELTLRER